MSLTGVGEVEGSEERVVVFGGDSRVRRVKENTVGAQQLVHLLLQLLLLLEDEGGGFGHVGHLHQGQGCRANTRTHTPTIIIISSYESLQLYLETKDS